MHAALPEAHRPNQTPSRRRPHSPQLVRAPNSSDLARPRRDGLRALLPLLRLHRRRRRRRRGGALRPGCPLLRGPSVAAAARARARAGASARAPGGVRVQGAGAGARGAAVPRRGLTALAAALGGGDPAPARGPRH